MQSLYYLSFLQTIWTVAITEPELDTADFFKDRNILLP